MIITNLAISCPLIECNDSKRNARCTEKKWIYSMSFIWVAAVLYKGRKFFLIWVIFVIVESPTFLPDFEIWIHRVPRTYFPSQSDFACPYANVVAGLFKGVTYFVPVLSCWSVLERWRTSPACVCVRARGARLSAQVSPKTNADVQTPWWSHAVNGHSPCAICAAEWSNWPLAACENSPITCLQEKNAF